MNNLLPSMGTCSTEGNSTQLCQNGDEDYTVLCENKRMAGKVEYNKFHNEEAAQQVKYVMA